LNKDHFLWREGLGFQEINGVSLKEKEYERISHKIIED
jgi:hypothetical protein